MEDLPLGRTVALVPEFAVNDQPLGRTLMMIVTIILIIIIIIINSNSNNNNNRGRRVIGISRSLIWSRTLMELIFNPCGEFQ